MFGKLALLILTPLVNPIGAPVGSMEGVDSYGAVSVVDSTETAYRTGEGVRNKPVGISEVKVYVANSYIDSNGGIPFSDPLGTLAHTNLKVMVLTMLRDVTADQIRSGWEESLTANNIDLGDPGIKSILDQITFDIASGTEVDIIGRGDDLIEIQAGDHHFYSIREPGLTLNFWKSWFGEPCDAGMDDLKHQLTYGG